MNSSGDSNVVSKNEEAVVLSNCQGGIGIKMVGGKTTSGPSYGIFVKRTIPGSPAARDGCLREGDKILKVNKEDMLSVTNERAMSVLLNASKAGVVTFLVERSETSHREYVDLMGTLANGLSPTKYASVQSAHSSGKSERTSPTPEKRSWVLAGGRMSPMSPGRTSPANLRVSLGVTSEKGAGGRKSLYADFLTNGERPSSLAESNVDSGLHSSSSTLNNLTHVSAAHIPLTNGLGMSITGGVNHPDGPGVVVKELINGGDVHCHGEIKQGDQIVSINGESFLNVTHEEAKMKLTQIKLRTDKEFEITYTPHGTVDMNKLSDVGSSAAGVKLPYHNPPVVTSNRELRSGLPKAQSPDENGNFKPSEVYSKLSSPTERFSSIMQSSIQPSSIQFYLQQDLAVSPELSTMDTSLTSTNAKHVGQQSRSKKSPKRRLSMAPGSKMRVEKLEVALTYLGIQLTPEQQQEIRARLHVDATGLVSYGEFVDVTQEVLRVELQDRSQTLNQGKLQFALRDIEKNGLKLDNPSIKTDDTATEELERQRDDAIAEARELRQLLEEKRSSRIAEVEQLESIKRTAEEALEESMALKDQMHLASQAKIAAERKDEEYEEIIRMLEDELHLVKAKGTPKQQEFQDLQSKVIVLGCQLRKIEVIKRTYEVVTERLLSFADHVHDCLRRGALSPSAVSHSSPVQNGGGTGSAQQPPSYLSQRHVSQKLADEARDLVRGVRVLLEEEPLPFGWEEAYTSEGERYFINHVTQVTSWLHPVSRTKKEKTEEV